MIKASSTPTALPRIGEGKRGKSGHIGYLLRQAAGVQRNRMESVLSDFGLTAPQFAVLTMIAAYPGHSNADLARVSLLTPQTVSVIIANLLKAGLVMRHPHQIHGRIQQLELTPEGAQLLKAAKTKVYALERKLLSGLSGTEEEIVRRWLVFVAGGSHDEKN
jgi:DNA-binding MarR family transcriptional regulator